MERLGRCLLELKKVMVIKIKLNGEEKRIDKGTSINTLLSIFNIPKETITVELNRKIVHRQMFESTVLKEGDAVELIRFVGGG